MATIIGSAGVDTLLGTPFDDVIETRGGADVVDAGAGDDIVRLTGPASADWNHPNIIDGNSGYDILDLTGWQGKLTDVYIGNDTFAFYQYSSPDMSHLDLVGYVRGFEEIHLGPGVQYFSAYQEVSDEPDRLIGYTIVGSEGADYIEDSRGRDRIDAGGGNDIVFSHGGSDRISLGDGDDYIGLLNNTGYQDNVTIDGGAGTDHLAITPSVNSPHIVIDLAAGTGQVGATSLTLTDMDGVTVAPLNDPSPVARTVEIAGDDHGNRLTGMGDAQTILLGRGGDDTLTGYQLQGALTAFGGSGSDTISGGDGSDWINGGGHYAGDSVSSDTADDGADNIDGGGGNDHIFGNSQVAVQGAIDGGDFIHGGDGLDYVNGNGGDDYIFGDAGGDRLYGGAGNDNIDGGIGDDHVNGNKGNDTIAGGDGNDGLWGGQGDDRLSGGNGFDTLTGDAGNDTFDIAGFGHFATSGPDAYRTDVISDFHDGQDLLALSLVVSTVAYPGSAADAAGAFALAVTALSGAADSAVAAVQVGTDTYLFYDNHSGPQSAVLLLNVSANVIDAHDFVV